MKVVISICLLLITNILFCQKLLPFKRGAVYGYLGVDGTTVIEPIYDKVKPFNDKNYAIVTLNNRMMIIDTLGKRVERFSGVDIPKGEFDSVRSTEGRFYIFRLDGRVGSIDSTFNIIAQFEGKHFTRPKHSDFYIVRKERGNAVYDRKSNLIFSVEDGLLNQICSKHSSQKVLFYKKLRSVKRTGSVVAIFDGKGNTIFEGTFDKVAVKQLGKEEYILVYKDDRVDIYDWSFKLIKGGLHLDSYKNDTSVFGLNTPFQYLDYSKIFGEKKDTKCQLIDTLNQRKCICFEVRNWAVYINGGRLFPKGEYEEIYRENFEIILNRNKETGKIGAVGINEEMILAPEFTNIHSQSRYKNLMTEKKDTFRFFNLAKRAWVGQPFKYANYAILQKFGSEKFALHDGTGNAITKFEYDTIFQLGTRQHFFASKGKRNFVLNEKGAITTKLNIDDITWLHEVKCYKVKKGEVYGVLNKAGDWIAAPQFSSVNVFKNKSSKPMLVVENLEGEQNLMNENGIVLDVYRDLIKKIQRTLCLDVTWVYLLDGSQVIFAPDGQLIYSTTDDAFIRIDDRLLEKNLIIVNGNYVNVKTGMVYE